MDNKIVIYFKDEIIEYEVPNNVIKGVMMILDEAISSDAIDWMSSVTARWYKND